MTKAEITCAQCLCSRGVEYGDSHYGEDAATGCTKPSNGFYELLTGAHLRNLTTPGLNWRLLVADRRSCPHRRVQ
jgi:hypothetical protein